MKKILPTEITQFIGELAMLMESGISINQALEIVQQGQEKPAMHKLIVAIKTDIHNGISLADSWAKYPQYFEPFIIERMHKNLAVTLSQITEYRESLNESEKNLTQELRYSFSYLMVMTIIFLAVSSLLLIYVIPTFSKMYNEIGASLPTMTVFIIKISNFCVNYNWFILSGLLGLGLLLRFQWHTVKLYLPLLGNFYHKVALTRFLRTSAFMLSQKVSLTTAFEAAAQAVNNPIYAKSLKQVSQQIATGTSLTNALTQHTIFPKKVIHATIIGTQTNQLDKLLVKLADVYTKQLSQLIKPIIKVYNFIGIILIAIIIGIFVISMYIPIFVMGSLI
jgi:type IV pilus assembly protein PilC